LSRSSPNTTRIIRHRRNGRRRFARGRGLRIFDNGTKLTCRVERSLNERAVGYQTTTSMTASLLRVAARHDPCPKGVSTGGHEATTVPRSAERARVARSAVYRPVRPVIKTGETRGYSRRPMRCRYVVVSRNCAAVCDGSAVRRSNSAPSAVIALAIDVRMPVTQSVWDGCAQSRYLIPN
jgi:hypothetical protein